MQRKEKVTKVIDGDTFETNRRKHPVRLSNVDTPEKRQPGYQYAKKELSDMILNKEVTIDTVARNKYGRSVANVKVGVRSVNKEMKKHQKWDRHKDFSVSGTIGNEYFIKISAFEAEKKTKKVFPIKIVCPYLKKVNANKLFSSKVC